ncbi:MAG: hypothetical protein BGO69_00060 [Bacteroidetes bacterium 46-16]|nr:MAG: hypothetical protein BGO69_00060 [Bacteroidetes bacterium 46-16]
MHRTCSVVLVGILFLFSSFDKKNIPVHSFKPESHITVKVPEPSDVVYDEETGHLFVVSDNGLLYECEASGKVIRRSPDKGMDFEGIEVKGDYLYISDESPRTIYKYNKKTLKIENTYHVPYFGARNSGFESITYNATKHCFVLVSEKNPIKIFEYNEDFQSLRDYSFHAARDISSARWYKGQMYLLSDEDMCIFRCDPNTYEVKEKFKIDILNPEGLTFDKTGNVIISADDLERLYFFKTIPANNE